MLSEGKNTSIRSISRFLSTLAVGVCLLFALFSVSFGNDIADAQSVASIQTSADDHGAIFFGGSLQIIIEDPETDDQAADSIDVDIEIEEDGGAATSATFSIPNTSDGSQRFEFFLVHIDSPVASPADPVNGSPVIIRFGNDASADLEVAGFNLYDKGSIQITYQDQTVTIDYDESTADLQADREFYGSTNLVHLFLIDQDGNLDSTTADSFVVLQADANLLFHSTGGTFVDDITFTETGDNTAQFEAVLQLTAFDTPLDPELQFESEVITIELKDMANYNDQGFDNPENESTDTSEIAIAIDDVDGAIEQLGTITFGSELSVLIRDDDQNLDSDQEDSIQQVLIIQVDSIGGDIELPDLEETGDNTGIFAIDLTNAELRVTFLEDGAEPTPDNGLLELRSADISADIVIEYFDPLDDNSEQSVTAQFVFQMTVVNGDISLPEVGVVGEPILLNITDMDLNNNRRVRDVYGLTLEGEGPHPLTRAGIIYGEVAQFELNLNGSPMNFATPITITLTENAINSGEFSATIDLAELLMSAQQEVQDGDELEMVYRDLMSGDISNSDTMVFGAPQTPSDMLEELIEFTSANDIDARILKPAAKLLNDDVAQNDPAVCKILETFSNQIDRQSGKKISAELSDEIQTMIAEIREQLEC